MSRDDASGCIEPAVLFLACVSILLLVGCSKAWPTEDAATPQELAVVDETAKASARHQVDVRAEITDKVDGNDGRAGWLVGHVAYFLRSEINQYPVERMRELAVHEVCHAEGGFPYPHDIRHWCCMKLDGEVGYEPPIKINGQWPTCEEFKR